MKLQTKYGPRIAETIRSGTEHDFNREKPKLEISKNNDAAEKLIEDESNKILYNAKVKNFIETRSKYNNDLVRTHSKIMEWCLELMQR